MTADLDTVLGRAFAAAHSDAQARVLNAAGAFAQQTYGGRGNVEMQACFIADHLDTSGWMFIRAIAQFDPQSLRE